MVFCKKNKQIIYVVSMYIRIVTKNSKFFRQPELSTERKNCITRTLEILAQSQNKCSKVPSSASQNVDIAELTTFIKNIKKALWRQNSVYLSVLKLLKLSQMCVLCGFNNVSEYCASANGNVKFRWPFFYAFQRNIIVFDKMHIDVLGTTAWYAFPYICFINITVFFKFFKFRSKFSLVISVTERKIPSHSMKFTMGPGYFALKSS